MRSFTTLDLQYAHRFYGFKGEAQYLHGHTGILTIEVEDDVNAGVNMVFPCNEIKKIAWEVLQNFDHALVLRRTTRCFPQFSRFTRSRASKTALQQTSRKDRPLRQSLPQPIPSAA